MTPTVFFTSDTHLWHYNIIRYCNRPFKDVTHMNEEIIRRWNETVRPEDIVYHLGDIALGPIEKSLPLVARLNGYKIAVMGNHDRPFMRAGKADENDWVERYEDVFQEVWHWNGLGLAMPEIGNIYVSHFPYTGDHTPTDRHADARPVDNGDPLVHGHTHSTDRLTFSSKGTPQVHVGQDAWDFRPVSEHEVARLIKGV